MICLHYRSAKQISTEPLPGPSFVLQMADCNSLIPAIKDEANVARWVRFLFNDAESDYGLVRSPSKVDAQAILKLFESAQELGVANFVAQCQAGKGRSQAVVAALCRKLGRDNTPILVNGTYNRKLYKLLMQEIGQPVVEPLVSIVVRVKYEIDRLEAFMLSMLRQRYQNWEVIAVTDGRREDIWRISQDYRGDPFSFVQTDVARGYWGNPYRQLGIDAARGEYIGLNNDDNYLSPGYIDQLVLAMERSNADLCACQVVHSYSGWSVTGPGSDICSWIAKADLVRRHPWNGTDSEYEWRYLKELEADGKCVQVLRPLIVHN